MNSRSSVNETNLVNFSTDLSTLNQLDTKDSLLSFPFDHIYASHSDNSDRRQTLQLNKGIEISTHCVVAEDKDLLVSNCAEISELAGRLASTENQNKRLKDLLIYHLDLIQQQNELITQREKLYRAIKLENDNLKSRLNRMDRRLAVNQKNCGNTSPFVHGVTTPALTSTTVKNRPNSASQIMLNSFTELVLSDNRTNSFKSEPLEHDSFQLSRTSEEDVTNYFPGELGVSSVLDNNLTCEKYSMIESKRSFIKKEMDIESRSDAFYSVTSNSGNPVIQRVQRSRRRTSSGIGRLSRMCNNLGARAEYPISSGIYKYDEGFEPTFSVNKKSKMINTYGKSRITNSNSSSKFTGSLSDRLQLIDTTPTGEDPYQLGEADMREQSPIPKLMLQKSNHGRIKICTDTSEEDIGTLRHLTTNCNVAETNAGMTKNFTLERYNLSRTCSHHTEIKSPKSTTNDNPDFDNVKIKSEPDWRMYNFNNPGTETSLCDFSYGETPKNLASHILPSFEFQELLSGSPPENFDSEKNNVAIEEATVKTRRKVFRSTSLAGSNAVGVNVNEISNVKHEDESKRGKKRALSISGLTKTVKCEKTLKLVDQRPKFIKGKVCRGKKLPTPGMVTRKPYHTLVGDPDVSWYLGLDPDIKLEDADQSGCTNVSTVEVPRWREKPYTCCYTLEGTENLDDKIFEKRHQKLEAEERRQLRWHMRRIREQRHVERLRQRQRDSWCAEGYSSVQVHPSMYTVWPQPQRDVRFIEITDSLPVVAFGEILPVLPETDFILPWVRTSKALKRSKRFKTMH